jgi:hypothetical protein
MPGSCSFSITRASPGRHESPAFFTANTWLVSQFLSEGVQFEKIGVEKGDSDLERFSNAGALANAVKGGYLPGK